MYVFDQKLSAENGMSSGKTKTAEQRCNECHTKVVRNFSYLPLNPKM